MKRKQEFLIESLRKVERKNVHTYRTKYDVPTVVGMTNPPYNLQILRAQKSAKGQLIFIDNEDVRRSDQRCLHCVYVRQAEHLSATTLERYGIHRVI